MSDSDQVASEYNGDTKKVVPVSHVTPEIRCACAEERVQRMLNLGMTPAEIISFITLSENINDDESDDE